MIQKQQVESKEDNEETGHQPAQQFVGDEPPGVKGVLEGIENGTAEEKASKIFADHPHLVLEHIPGFGLVQDCS